MSQQTVLKALPNETDLKVAEYLASLASAPGAAVVTRPVIFNVVYVGRIERAPWAAPGEKPNPVDLWSFTFQRAQSPTMSDQFCTGLGLRRLGVMAEKQAKRYQKTMGHIEYTRWKASESHPVYPTAASILYSLVRDYRYGEMSFYDWADDLGYDKDSMHANRIYNACCEHAQKMRQLFKREEITHLEELLQDY